jgi:hypothetical protein
MKIPGLLPRPSAYTRILDPGFYLPIIRSIKRALLVHPTIAYDVLGVSDLLTMYIT